MKPMITTLLVFVFLLTGSGATAQENVFLNRSYWKANPSITQVKQDITRGNNPSELNVNAFDAVVYAMLEKTDNETVKFLLEQEGNGVNKLTHDGRTYIFWAAYRGNLEMMQYLIDGGARTDIIDDHGNSLLNFAASTGQTNIKLYDFCIAHGANPRLEKNRNGANALLLLAPYLQDETLIRYFTDKGLNIHDKDDQGNGIFNYAAKSGNTDVMDMLIGKGVDFKTLNKEGGNAFIFASQGTRNHINSLETYKYLESLGLQPNVTTKDGLTPLHALGSKNKDLDIFGYFIEKGVDVNQPDRNGNTAFSNAASRNTVESIRFLAKHITDINLKNKIGQSALTRATERNTAEVLEFLLSKGAEVEVKDAKGNGLAYYLINSYSDANASAFEKKLQILQNAGLKMTDTQADGHSLWHLAVRKGSLALLEQVMTFGIPVNQKNDEGLTPLHLAAMKAKDTEILKFLIEKGADKTLKTEFDESVYDLAVENELLQKQSVELNFLQ